MIDAGSSGVWLAGVDGCRAGWIVAFVRTTGEEAHNSIVRIVPRFADGVGLAELGPLADPQLVPGTVASALRLTPLGGTASFESVAAAR